MPRPLLLSKLTRSVVVDRESGTIRGVSVITAGTTKTDAIGNAPMKIDGTTLAQVMQAINDRPQGIKVRMTHPEASGEDDITFRVGYLFNARITDNRVVADVRFLNPSDDDALRLMAIAEHDPASCGLSIVSTQIHHENNALRVGALDAVDFVGAPAANPAGMLSASAGAPNMLTEAQIQYLRGLGLPETATPEEAEAFVETLTDEQKAGMPAAEPDADEAVAAAESDAATDEQPVDAQETKEKAAPVAASSQTAPAPAAVAASATPTADPQAIALAERTRITEIRAVALKAGFDETFISKHTTEGTPIDEVRRVALNSLNRGPNDMPAHRVTVGADHNRDTLGQAVQDAIMLRAGARRLVGFDNENRVMLSSNGSPKIRQPHERSRDFRHHSLLDMGRRFLVALGYSEAERMGRASLADVLMSRSRMQAALPGVFLAQSSSDFPYLLADTMGKVLRGEYALAPHTWSMWARRTTAPDFKDIKSIQLSEAADLTVQAEGDEVEYGTLTESREVYALNTYSKGVKFTRQMLINDDLSAFDRVPRMLGRAAARNVESVSVAILTANAALADGSDLFSAEHNNLTTGTLSVTSLGTARSLLRRQTALGSSDPLELTPRFLMVPETIATTAEQLVSSTVDPAKSNATPNPFSNTLQVIPSARLDSNSTAQWYLLADPAEIDTVEVAFLEGEEEPVVLEEDEFDSDARKIKVRHQVAAKAIDFRGMVRSSGA